MKGKMKRDRGEKCFFLGKHVENPQTRQMNLFKNVSKKSLWDVLIRSQLVE